jgi:hypothetical protein
VASKHPELVIRSGVAMLSHCAWCCPISAAEEARLRVKGVAVTSGICPDCAAAERERLSAQDLPAAARPALVEARP